MAMKRKLRYGMVGGGQNAFIGAVHRMAAALDGQIELVAGAFSSDPKNSRVTGEQLFLDPRRVYGSYEEMAKAEAALPEGERIDFVSIVTPNHLHVPVAMAFLKRGFHVVCDKPLALSLREAKALRETVRRTGKVFALTHNYTGYPMVKEARELVRRGQLGRILKIVAEYPQGWLLDRIEAQGHKQAEWRSDPKRAGASCCVGDIGTHAENLARYITGLEIESLCAEFTTFVPGRKLEDDANLLVRYKGGAKGILYASQVSCGEENNLNIRVYGTKGSLFWRQEHPNELKFQPKGEPARILRRGNDYVSDVAKKFTRLPFGHPEAFIEAFANIYLEAAAAIRDHIAGKRKGHYDFPTIDDGVYGMAFIETAVKSAKSNSKWTRFMNVK
ncbi:MAG TPA: Gfo/Idh/MocA family oxidoreductase [Verrucomicrobia bacterium]|nr:Gfo/Idh/MocA family oxidoreductase [Verrucomicrobiota bacterium]HOB31410.1 Gfo/Idh/MocA family oxidoreductase [Verrucomicrobiota bacterium]HOP96326.1 Gfo/Idh/MocA family oxidoreductase [Verrucomicrobiota bacterium]HPU57727.1 Gfo/Idh/MocA family oxidoreductase [Verrucomicrobiota bacterium]